MTRRHLKYVDAGLLYDDGRSRLSPQSDPMPAAERLPAALLEAVTDLAALLHRCEHARITRATRAS